MKFKVVDIEKIKAVDSSTIYLVKFKVVNVTHESFGMKLSVKSAEKKESEKASVELNVVIKRS